jgi:hypothetical protein
LQTRSTSEDDTLTGFAKGETVDVIENMSSGTQSWRENLGEELIGQTFGRGGMNRKNVLRIDLADANIVVFCRKMPRTLAQTMYYFTFRTQ